MTQVSVEPNTSCTGAANRSSAARASSFGIGAVAETIAASGGSGCACSTNARKCTGVVTSTRGAGTSASAQITSNGKNGRAECTAASANSGSSTENSSPYMCCGGTVATTLYGKPVRPRSSASLCALLTANLSQRFGLDFGTPVEPEV